MIAEMRMVSEHNKFQRRRLAKILRKEYDKNYTANRDAGHKAALTAARYAQKLKATPSWANQFFIDEMYRLAHLRSKLTGIKWSVDHIVPLKSKTVCGLHVEHNLRVIPWSVNMAKKNSYSSCGGEKTLYF